VLKRDYFAPNGAFPKFESYQSALSSLQVEV
jgi:hypothetical protein